MKISDERVLQNIIQFKTTLLEKRKQFSIDKLNESKRFYLIFLNLDSGIFRFPEKIADSEDQLVSEGSFKKNEKQIHLLVSDKGGVISFKVSDSSGADLKSSEIKADALDILLETVNTLNALAKVTKRTSQELLPEDAMLSNIELSLDQTEIENLKEWVGHKNRLEIELMLVNSSSGTYYLREKDAITQSIIEDIQKNNPLISLLQSCILSVMGKNRKISEFLLIKTKQGWAEYQDDVCLEDYNYKPSVELVIKDVIQEMLDLMD